MKLKAVVNSCLKLYFINNAYKVVLYTDASDYVHRVYLCQFFKLTREGNERGTTSVVHLVELKFDGRRSKIEAYATQCIGRWESWTTYLGNRVYYQKRLQ